MQTIPGIISDAILRNNIKLPYPRAGELFVLLQNLKLQNQLVNDNLLKLTSILKRSNINFFVVKGQTIAAHYPNPYTRTPGDIDFYCSERDLSKVLPILNKEFNICIKIGESEKHLSFEYNNVEFELHFKLIKFACKSNQKIFDKLIQANKLNAISINNVNIPTLPPTLNLLYTFLHLYHHLLEVGVGLRQFCDMAILCHQYCDKNDSSYENLIDTVQLQTTLNDLGYTKAFKAIGAILIDELGLAENEFPLPINIIDRKKSKYLLKIVYKRGNFGKYNRKTKVRSGFLYYVEQFFIKLSHYLNLYELSPKEINSLLGKELFKKIILTLKR